MLAMSAEWAAVIASGAAAVGTLAATFVALFGPGWRERRRRPALRLVAAESETMTLYDAASAGGQKPDDGPLLTIANAKRKDSAVDVEVFVTVLTPYEEEGEELPIPIVERENLLFTSPARRAGDQWRTRVPRGFSRRVYFLLLGAPSELSASFREEAGTTSSNCKDIGQHAVLAAYPPTRDNMFWLSDGEYLVIFELTGANFDAQTYEGRFRLRRSKWENSL